MLPGYLPLALFKRKAIDVLDTGVKTFCSLKYGLVYPQIEPHAGIKVPQVLGSLVYIRGAE